MQQHYIIMGVSGSGKTTIGKGLATGLKASFLDADDYHPQENIEKMKAGNPLKDTDRIPWLKKLHEVLSASKKPIVLACSALKESYRTILAKGNEIQWIYLKGNFKTIQKRMRQREHFMDSSLLQSQFEALEPPSYGWHIEIQKDPNTIIRNIINKIKMKSLSSFGIIGMGVMGKSLAKNAAGKGISVSVYNRAVKAEEHIIPSLLSEDNSGNIQGFKELNLFIKSLASPRKILMMIPAGKPIDAVLETLIPLVSENDIIMDGGNSHYKDTQRRAESLLKNHKIAYIGLGVSGGELGALHGPSLMAGGSESSYKAVKAILEAIAAKDFNNKPCLALFGNNGAGHFVKTLHNGMEYAEMQLLAEVYALLKVSYTTPEITSILEDWQNKEALDSFLLTTTFQILKKKDGKDYLIEKVLDKAASKGTGTWSGHCALDLGIPASLCMEAVMARAVSQQKMLRKQLAQDVSKPTCSSNLDVKSLQEAYQFARIINHHQGFQVILEASKKEGWDIELEEVARVWTRGCILQSNLLEQLIPFLKEHSEILVAREIRERLESAMKCMVSTLQFGMEQAIALPCLSSALQYWYGITTPNSTASLIQAQRDSFGAHTYQRTDKPDDQSFTTNWS